MQLSFLQKARALVGGWAWLLGVAGPEPGWAWLAGGWVALEAGCWRLGAEPAPLRWWPQHAAGMPRCPGLLRCGRLPAPVHQPTTATGLRPGPAPQVGAFKPAYWQALLVVAVLYFARFDASFLSLRAKQVGGWAWV